MALNLKFLLAFLHALDLEEVVFLERCENFNQFIVILKPQHKFVVRIVDDVSQFLGDVELVFEGCGVLVLTVLVLELLLVLRSRLVALLLELLLALLIHLLTLFFGDRTHRQAVEELFEVVVHLQGLNVLGNVAHENLNFLRDLAQFVRFVVFKPSVFVHTLGRLLSLLLDVVEELQEGLRVSFEHVFRASQTILTHGCVLGQPLDLFLLGLEHLLHQEHLSLLLNELPAVFPVLGALNRDREPRSFINFALDFWINGQLGRFDIGFTNFTEAPLSGGPVFLPDLELLVLLALEDLAVLLDVLEGEDQFIRGHGEGIYSLLSVKGR